MCAKNEYPVLRNAERDISCDRQLVQVLFELNAQFQTKIKKMFFDRIIFCKA
jgi:hypothetical protein